VSPVPPREIGADVIVDQDYLSKTTGLDPHGDWADVEKLFEDAERDQARANRGESEFIEESDEEMVLDEAGLEGMGMEDDEGEKENEKGDAGGEAVYGF
jgi:hypothetical protein